MYDDILVKDWPGLDAETMRKLLDHYVNTLKAFLRSSEEEEWLEVAQADGLTNERIAALRTEAQQRLAALPEVRILGKLHAFAETGSEGFGWAVYEDGKTGYEGLHLLEDGHHLTVTDATGAVRFEGFIASDHRTGWQEYPLRPGEGLGQPVALGFWVWWIQAGWEPDVWAQLFFDEHRAVLTYNKKKV